MFPFPRHVTMHNPFVRAIYVALAGVSTLLLAACSDRKEVGEELLEPVTAGFPRDSLFQLLGKGPLIGHYADTLRVDHGFRLSKYYVDGQYLEVVFYREMPGDVAESVKQDVETPIVLKDGKVLGWGWAFYVKEGMTKFGLPTPLKEEVPTVLKLSPATQAPAAQTGPQS
jgi:hypothetical protein